jgi:glutamyl-tRNA reductase
MDGRACLTRHAPRHRPGSTVASTPRRASASSIAPRATSWAHGFADVARAVERRRHRPMCLIDISVPRQVDPAAGEIDGVFLFDMDDLQRVAESNVREREREARLAESIVDDEVTKYLARLRASDIGPTVAELKGRLNEVAIGEYSRLRKKLGDLTPDQEEAITTLLLPSIINKISHPIISHMREGVTKESGGEESVSIWRRIFRLGGDDV